MDPVLNPYSPGAGSPPPELAGRDELLAAVELALTRVRRGKPQKSVILVGLRGVGKTVLLNRFDVMARGIGYHTALIENTEQKRISDILAPQVRRMLFELDRMGDVSKAVKRAMRVFKSFVSAVRIRMPGDVEVGIDIDPEVGTADSGDLDVDLADLFVAVGEAAVARKTSVAIIVDELQYLKPAEFSALIVAMHRINQLALPLIFIGAGLPVVVGLAGKSKSYAERLFDFPVLGPLRDADARLALTEPARLEGVAFDDAALTEIVRITACYPYFIQEWGYQTWNVGRRSPLEYRDVSDATRKALERLDEGFFRVRFDRLTPSEKRYARAMAELGPGPHRSGDIANAYGTDVMAAGAVRAKLIAKGMIYSPAHGDNAFTVPLFDDYLHRAMPEWPLKS